jgi:hypothetical protein
MNIQMSWGSAFGEIFLFIIILSKKCQILPPFSGFPPFYKLSDIEYIIDILAFDRLSLYRGIFTVASISTIKTQTTSETLVWIVLTLMLGVI